MNSFVSIIHKLLPHPSQEALSKNVLSHFVEMFNQKNDPQLLSRITNYLENRYDHILRWENANKSAQLNSLDHLKKTANRVGLEWPTEFSLKEETNTSMNQSK